MKPYARQREKRGPIITKMQMQHGGLVALFSEEAEKAVLGSMLSHPEEVIDVVLDTLKKEDFFVPSHQEVFDAIKTVFKSNQSVDIMTVHQWLKDRHLDEMVGSPGILAEIGASFVSHLNAGTHIKIVKGKSTLRHLQNACLEIMQEVSDGEKEPNDILDGAERRLMGVATNETPSLQMFRDEADRAISEALAWTTEDRALRGITTGFTQLDELTAGWCPGEFIAVAGRAKKGKTAMLLKFAYEMMKVGKPAIFFSMEMSKIDLIHRLICMHASASLLNLRRGRMSEYEVASLNKIREEVKAWPLIIEDDTHQTMDQIRSKVRRAKRKFGIEAAFLDYIALVKAPEGKKERHEVIAEISRTIKGTAKETQIPFIAAAQLNRNAAEGRPMAHQLAESDAIGRDVDKLILLHDNPDGTQNPGANIPYDVILEYQRSGPTGDIRAIYSSWRALFYEEQKPENKSANYDD